MDERRLELKVGALVLVAVGGVLGLLWLMGELSLGSGTALAVEFSHTGNVVKGAPVKLGGVQVGKVERITLTPDRRDGAGDPLPVRMDLSVSPAAVAALKSDMAVTVATQGPLGEPYLELFTGSAAAPKLAAGAVVRGTDAARLDQVAARLGNFLSAASRVLEEDPQALSHLVQGVSGLSHTLDGVLSDNRGDLHALTQEITAAAKDMRALAAIARKDLEPGGKGASLLDDAAASAHLVRQDLPQMSIHARLILAGLAATAGSLTEEDGQKLKGAIDKYAAAGDSLDKIATRAERLLGRIEAGEGSIGGLSKDPAVYQDLKEFIKDLRKHPWKVLWKD